MRSRSCSAAAMALTPSCEHADLVAGGRLQPRREIAALDAAQRAAAVGERLREACAPAAS